MQLPREVRTRSRAVTTRKDGVSVIRYALGEADVDVSSELSFAEMDRRQVKEELDRATRKMIQLRKKMDDLDEKIEDLEEQVANQAWENLARTMLPSLTPIQEARGEEESTQVRYENYLI